METKQVIASVLGAVLVAGSLFGAATVLTDPGGVQVDQVSSVETVEPASDVVEPDPDGVAPDGAPTQAPTPATPQAPADSVMAATPYPADAAGAEQSEYEDDHDEDEDDDD